MANKVETILEEIKGLTLLEAADLVKNFLRSMHCSGSLILSSCADQVPKSLYGAPIMPEPLVSTNGVVPGWPAIRNNAVIGESAPGWRFQTIDK